MLLTYLWVLQGATDVEIRITHCGICHSDVHLNKGDWPGFADFSAPGQVSGHEIVGVVSQTGASVSHLMKGDRVAVGWYKSACGRCHTCLADEHSICDDAIPTCAAGSRGGFAEAIRVPADYAFRVPEALPSEFAAPLMCGGITVYAPLSKYAPPAARVGVVSIGGLGAMAVQFARARGNVVTAISTTADKEPLARELGAHHFVVSTDAAAMRAARNSLDVIIVTTSGPIDSEPFLSLLRQNGTLIFVGAIDRALPVVPFGPLMMKQLRIVGSATGGRGRIVEMLDFAAAHAIHPRIELFKFDEINTAIERVEKNRVRFRAVLHF